MAACAVAIISTGMNNISIFRNVAHNVLFTHLSIYSSCMWLLEVTMTTVHSTISPLFHPAQKAASNHHTDACLAVLLSDIMDTCSCMRGCVQMHLPSLAGMV